MKRALGPEQVEPALHFPPESPRWLQDRDGAALELDNQRAVVLELAVRMKLGWTIRA